MSETKKRMAEYKRKADGLNPPPQSGSAEAYEIDLVELFFRFLSSWKLIVCLALVVAIAAGAYTHFLVTPMYKATSIIYVLNRNDSVINMSDLQIGSALTNDYIKVFNMWEVQERVISQLDLPYSYKQIQNMISVTNASNTRMLDISAESASPAEAAAIANAYAEVVCDYIAENMAMEKPSIMSVALEPANPVSPNKTRNVLLGFFLGAVLAMGIVTAQMLTDDKYKTADDIRKYTGLPTLATIPADDSLKKMHGGKKKAKRKESI